MATNSSMVSLTLLTQSAFADWLLKQLVIIYYNAPISNERSILLNIVSTINKSSLTSCGASIIKLLLNVDESLDLETNTVILNATVSPTLSSKRFDGPVK